jgi:outer membrane protein
MKLLFLNIFLALAVISQAQVHTIGLEESKDSALNYSYAIKNSLLSIQSAEAGKKGAEASQLPSLSGNVLGMYGFKKFVDPIPLFLEKGINNFYYAGATAMEPVFVGGKIRTGIALSNLQIEVEKTKAKLSKDSVALITEQKYWQIVTLQEQQKTLKANELLLDAVLKQQKDLLASGLIARNDLLKVKVKKSQLILDQSKLSNGHKLALFDFSLYLGIDFDSLLIAKDTFGVVNRPESEFINPESALMQNNNYDLLKKSMDAQQLQTKYTKADYLPSVAVGVSAGQFGVIGNGQISKFVPVGIGSVSIPISALLWGNGKQKMIQQHIQENIVKNNFEDGIRQIKTGILKSWYDVQDAYEQINLANESYTSALENMKVNQDNYVSGLAGITEVLDAQAAFQQSSSDRVTAFANYREKLAEYKYMVGIISKSQNAN